MKKFFFVFILSLFFYSCANKIKMGKSVLSDGTEIELSFTSGGATTQNSVWVSKQEPGKDKMLIAVIDGYDHKSKFKVFRKDQTHILLRLIDDGGFSEYLLDLNRTINYNDGTKASQPQPL